MGQDIRAIFEQRNDAGQYELLFPRVPDEEWYYDLPYAFYKDGRGMILCGSSDRDTVLQAVMAYLSTMSAEEGAERYGTHPDFWWRYTLPNFPGLEIYDRFTRRDYTFFRYLEALVPGHGLPSDCSAEARHWENKNEYCYGSVDVDSLIDYLTLKRDCQWHLRWLKTFISKPTETRMLFTFSY